MGNLLLGRPCSSSSYVLPYEPGRAVDGIGSDPTSRWLCNQLPGWLMVDMRKVYLINRWVVKNMGIITGWNYSDGSYNMCEYKLQGSMDGMNWFDINRVSGNTNAKTDMTFTDVSARFVRLYVTRGLNINLQLASCIEFEVYEHPSADLENLNLDTGTLEPVFSANVTDYTAYIGYDDDGFILTPVTKDPNAEVTMTVDGTVVSASNEIPIDVGASKVVRITVTAGNGTVQKVYTVNAIRATSPYLSSLATSPPITSGNFEKTTYAYTIKMKSSTTAVKVKYTLDDSTAEVTINDVKSTTNSISVSVTGINQISIVVKSGCGEDTRQYIINLEKS